MLLLAGYAAVACLLYGALLNLWFWPFLAGTATTFSFVPGAGFVENLHRFVLFDLTTSLGFDIPRAVTNAALVLVLGRPVLAALRRASRRAAFGAPVVHVPAPTAVGPGAGDPPGVAVRGPVGHGRHGPTLVVRRSHEPAQPAVKEEATVSLTYEEALAQVTGPDSCSRSAEATVDGRTSGCSSTRRPTSGSCSPAPGATSPSSWSTRTSAGRSPRRCVTSTPWPTPWSTTYGIRKGDRVGIAMRNLPEWIVSFAAVLSIGAVSVSLNAWWTESELDYAIEDSGLSLLIADPERIERAHAPAHSRGVPMIMVRGDLLEPTPTGVRPLRRGGQPRRPDARGRRRTRRRRHHPLHVGDHRVPQGRGLDPPGRDQRPHGLLV